MSDKGCALSQTRNNALPGRLELPTLRLTASRSNQLSYGSHVMPTLCIDQCSAQARCGTQSLEYSIPDANRKVGAPTRRCSKPVPNARRHATCTGGNWDGEFVPELLRARGATAHFSSGTRATNRAAHFCNHGSRAKPCVPQLSPEMRRCDQRVLI